MIRKTSIGFLLLAASSLQAQEQLGAAHSNYAGTDALSLNPARMAEQWQWTDVNLLGADVYAWNDHVYVTGKDRSMLGEVRQSLQGSSGDGFVFNESLEGGDRHAFVSARLKGPAVSISMGRSSIGAHISSRMYTSATGLGTDLARYLYNGLNFAPQHGNRYTDNGLKLASAAWSEVGISYARIIKAQGFHLLSVGATGRYIQAHYGAGIAFSSLDYTVMDSMRAVVHNASGEYGIASPAFNAGTGFGFDVGITYTRTLEEADGYVPHQSGGGCDPLGYRYRIGISVIDIGGMHFADASSGKFDASTAYYPDYNAIDVNSRVGADSLLRNSLSTFVPVREFGIGLPTAVAVQYDQRIVDHVYVAADIIQNIAPPTALRLRRTNTLAIVPRFEHQRYEVALPVVVHEYELLRPSVGLMLRLNNVIVGSDHLLPLITRSPAYGADVYFRLKWTIFRSPHCRGKKHASHRQGDRNALPCSVPQ